MRNKKLRRQLAAGAGIIACLFFFGTLGVWAFSAIIAARMVGLCLVELAFKYPYHNISRRIQKWENFL